MDKLAIINELEVVESSCHDETCEYVLIEKSEENIEVLKELGADDENIKNMDELEFGDTLDISQFAFNKLEATWYEPDTGFSYDEH